MRCLTVKIVNSPKFLYILLQNIIVVPMRSYTSLRVYITLQNSTNCLQWSCHIAIDHYWHQNYSFYCFCWLRMKKKVIQIQSSVSGGHVSRIWWVFQCSVLFPRKTFTYSAVCSHCMSCWYVTVTLCCVIWCRSMDYWQRVCIFFITSLSWNLFNVNMMTSGNQYGVSILGYHKNTLD